MKKHIGKYVKRFYTAFKEENIFKIEDHRINQYGIEEFLYANSIDCFWCDVEDSVVITDDPSNEDGVACVNDKDYMGYNPYIK